MTHFEYSAQTQYHTGITEVQGYIQLAHIAFDNDDLDGELTMMLYAEFVLYALSEEETVMDWVLHEAPNYAFQRFSDLDEGIKESIAKIRAKITTARIEGAIDED